MAMTFKQVAKMIKDIGLPFSYYQFNNDTAVAPPFICYFYTGDNDLLADNSNYQKIENLVVELYTDEKDFANEALIETALNDACLVYNREESYLDSEKMYMVIYSCGVVITEV